MVSNAFEKSSITTPVCLFWSYDCSRSFKVTISCVSHEYPDLNPWFKDVRMGGAMFFFFVPKLFFGQHES